MKVKLLFFLIIVAALTMSSFACLFAKTTGGGAFYDEDGNYVTFGFNAQPVGEPYTVDEVTFQDAKGQFQLVNHTTKTKINGSFTDALVDVESEDLATLFWGTCTVNKQGPFTFQAAFYDSNMDPESYDTIGIWVDINGNYDFGDEGDLGMGGELLEGSDIVIHTPK